MLYLVRYKIRKIFGKLMEKSERERGEKRKVLLNRSEKSSKEREGNRN